VDEAVLTWADELLFSVHGAVERDGWALVHKLRIGRTPACGHTIGLSARFDHPELVVVGLDQLAMFGLLGELAPAVTRGERFDALPEGRFVVRGHPFRVVPVHLEQWWTDRFELWWDYYGSGVLPPPRALQVLWPDPWDRLPGDPEIEPRVRRLQPRLDRAPRRPSRGRARPM
jgi:Domain of unknown function (DUF4262)